jgi:hypothetical protein
LPEISYTLGVFMGRRSASDKSLGALIVLAIVIGIPIYIASQLWETMGWTLPAVIIGIIIFLVVRKIQRNRANAAAEEERLRQIEEARKARLQYLRDKYQNEEIVQLIQAQKTWVGQTEEQLLDSFGEPESVDEKRLKTKKREIWKYNHQGANRYGTRITVDNGVVAGWDHKD